MRSGRRCETCFATADSSRRGAANPRPSTWLQHSPKPTHALPPGLHAAPSAAPPSPPAIPRRSGTVYFELDKRSPDWEAIKMARNLALDLPPDFRGVQVELLALEGSR